ncbi:hypothetical protein [Dyadobacter sp. CY347]|uniref:hypothetical protein n=1 Tax=Dyadobacter sp. CY347 TaxID=2909336 RepID=UPI001F29446E|nr:hypothetical protein [Dyadobacter sp. CY347]
MSRKGKVFFSYSKQHPKSLLLHTMFVQTTLLTLLNQHNIALSQLNKYKVKLFAGKPMIINRLCMYKVTVTALGCTYQHHARKKSMAEHCPPLIESTFTD